MLFIDAGLWPNPSSKGRQVQALRSFGSAKHDFKMHEWHSPGEFARKRVPVPRSGSCRIPPLERRESVDSISPEYAIFPMIVYSPR